MGAFSAPDAGTAAATPAAVAPPTFLAWERFFCGRGGLCAGFLGDAVGVGFSAFGWLPAGFVRCSGAGDLGACFAFVLFAAGLFAAGLFGADGFAGARLGFSVVGRTVEGAGSSGCAGCSGGSCQPCGGRICTMPPHLGQFTIWPMAALSRTLSRASQVVQVMWKSTSAKTSTYFLFRTGDMW